MNIFHFVIIAFFVILINGCGYKANPYYSSVNLEIDSRVLDCHENATHLQCLQANLAMTDYLPFDSH